MATNLAQGPLSAESVETADQAVAQIAAFVAAHRQANVQINVEGQDEPITIPREAMELLQRILASMAAGQAVSVVPAHAELTTRQAADILNVSRPYLISLLEKGAIEYRKVGTHRRVIAKSLLDYKERSRLVAKRAADEMLRLDQEIGLP